MGTISDLEGGLGIHLQRPAADLFDGTTTSVFTVTGGRVFIMALSMETSVGAADGANAVKFVGNPTVGTSIDLCATLDVDTDEIGTVYSITGTLSDALDGTVAGGVASMAKPIIVNEGTIDISSGGDSNNTNSALQTVDLFYIPLDQNASVAVA